MKLIVTFHLLDPSHSNVPKIIGVSDKSSANSFIVFRGGKPYDSRVDLCLNIVKELVSEKRIQPLLAKALRTDLNRSVELSMKTVSSHIHAKC